jgi:hypothetical protein
VDRRVLVGIGGVTFGVVALLATCSGDGPPTASPGNGDAGSTPTAVVLTVVPPSGTVPVVVTTAPRTTPSTAPDDGLNPLGGNSPEDDLMPDVVCMDLQDAQDEIQDHGVFLSRSVDASGEGRRQVWDRNWVVVRQTPAPGEQIGENDAVLYVLKDDETQACG